MIEINLLPKDFRKGTSALSLGRAGLYLVSAAAGIVVLLVAVTFYQMNQLEKLKTDIDRANQRASMLRQDIRIVDGLMDVKDKIHRRIGAVERLDRYRSSWVRILEDMGRNVPEFVWLDVVRELAVEVPAATPSDDKSGAEVIPVSKEIPASRPVLIRGFAFTLNALAATMIKMMRSDYFDEVELVNSYDTLYSGEKTYRFELSANVHYLSDEELRGLVAQAKTKPTTQPKHARLN